MANINPNLLEALQKSTCFGLLHDESVPECKQCDVKSQCAKRSEGAMIPIPTKKPASAVSTVEETKIAKTTTKPASSKKAEPKATNKTATSTAKKPPTPKKSPKAPSGNTPDFKAMGLEELKDLAKERGIEWKEYGNDNITRMRLVMDLKKSY